VGGSCLLKTGGFWVLEFVVVVVIVVLVLVHFLR
jgi:hypothetical protein